MEAWIHAELLCLTSTSKKKGGGEKDAARICGILICLFCNIIASFYSCTFL